jgi:hypothetical protein
LLLSFKTQHSKFKIACRSLCHSQALVIRQRVFVFQNSLFAAQPDEELWRRMNTGVEQQGEGMIGNKKLTF